MKEAARAEALRESPVFAGQRDDAEDTSSDEETNGDDFSYPREDQWSSAGIAPQEKADPGVGSDGSGDPHGIRDGRATPHRTGPPGSERADEGGAAKKQCSCGKDARSFTIKLVRRGNCLLESKVSFNMLAWLVGNRPAPSSRTVRLSAHYMAGCVVGWSTKKKTQKQRAMLNISLSPPPSAFFQGPQKGRLHFMCGSSDRNAQCSWREIGPAEGSGQERSGASGNLAGGGGAGRDVPVGTGGGGHGRNGSDAEGPARGKGAGEEGGAELCDCGVEAYLVTATEVRPSVWLL